MGAATGAGSSHFLIWGSAASAARSPASIISLPLLKPSQAMPVTTFDFS